MDDVGATGRRLSAGLSLKYDAGGEHVPKYSECELSVAVQKGCKELRAQHDAEVRYVG